MSTNIRLMTEKDKSVIFEMMKIFYNSPAVFTNGSDEIYHNDIENCINDNPYLEGYILEEKDKIVGYAMIAKSFSTEFGKQCIWIEDLYIKEEYRGFGIGTYFLNFISKKYVDALIRLEVEEENTIALNVYKKNGFDILPYMEMYK